MLQWVGMRNMQRVFKDESTAAKRQNRECNDQRPAVHFSAVAKRMRDVRLPPAQPDTQQEQTAIAHVNERMDAFRELLRNSRITGEGSGMRPSRSSARLRHGHAQDRSLPRRGDLSLALARETDTG